MNKKKLSFKEAKQRAGRFCALRERSPHEVIEKGKSWGLNEQEAADLVQELTSQGFLNEQRFVNAFCNDKFEFHSWGKQKIKAAIYPHKITSSALDEALDRIDPVRYEARLVELANRKWQSVSDDDAVKRKQKTVSYLANKGFELDLIWKIVGQLEQ